MYYSYVKNAFNVFNIPLLKACFTDKHIQIHMLNICVFSLILNICLTCVVLNMCLRCVKSIVNQIHNIFLFQNERYKIVDFV